MLLLVSQVGECVVVVLLCCDDALYTHTIVLHTPHWTRVNMDLFVTCKHAWHYAQIMSCTNHKFYAVGDPVTLVHVWINIR